MAGKIAVHLPRPNRGSPILHPPAAVGPAVRFPLVETGCAVTGWESYRGTKLFNDFQTIIFIVSVRDLLSFCCRLATSFATSIGSLLPRSGLLSHPPICYQPAIIPLLHVGSSRGLEVGERGYEFNGRATGNTSKLFACAAQFARAVVLVHCAQQINPNAASSGRA